MRVKMRQRISGTRNGQVWPAAGESLELPESEARDLVRLGYAESADEPEAAIDPKPVETATQKTTPRRKPSGK